MVKVSAWHKFAADTLRKRGVKDHVSGEVFIDFVDARYTLGVCLKVKHYLQPVIIRELKEFGLIEIVNRRKIRVLKK